jgi:hypothetical protein
MPMQEQPCVLSLRIVAKRAAEFLAVLIVLLGCMATNLRGQASATKSTEAVFVDATVAAHNIEEAISSHLTGDANIHLNKQLPEDKRGLPPPLIKRDGSFEFDWTVGQHARYLMEELRQGIHQLQSVEKASGLDGIALAGARENWPKVRDISCHESPGIRYFDLDGFEQYCPEH